MKPWLLFFIVPYVLNTSALTAAGVDNLLLGNEESFRIIVNNRVLTTVNGKPITVIDVMKRMDLLFLKQFPEYTSSVSARHQFYQANWKRILSELIDKELILADAKEAKMEVANGDVRQEMEELFGPNIILNLDKIGLSLDEATKIVAGDILIRRMIFLKVTAKAMGKVTPQLLRDHYENYAKNNAKPTVLTYQMLTLRHPDPQQGKVLAEKIHNELSENKIPLEKLKEQYNYLSLSAVVTQTEKEIAPQNKDILLKLKQGEVSPLTQQTSRDEKIVWRLFTVLGREEGSKPTYQAAEPSMKEELLDVAMSLEQKDYLNRLRRHFAVKEGQLQQMIPDEFTPFSLK